MQSVLSQDYSNIEYIVVDGASSDGSQEIIQSHEKSLAWWISESDSGQAEAINKGFAKAKGEIIAWLNSDDLYKPGAITSAVKQLMDHPEMAMVYGDLDSIRRDGKRFNTIHYARFGLLDFLSFRMIGQPSVFIRRKMIPEGPLLDESYHYLLDHHLWLRLAKEHPNLHVPEIWATARHHSGAKNRAQAEKFGEEAFRIIEWAKSEPKSSELIKRHRRKIVGGAHRLDARYKLEASLAGASVSTYLRAFANSPIEFARSWKHFLLALFSWLGLAWLVPANYESRKPILVTGIHRSGTSWVGRMLNLSGRTAYISEPLNVLHRPGVLDAEIKHWYTYISKALAPQMEAAFQDTLNLRYKFGKELNSLRSDRDLLRMLRDAFVFFRGRLTRQRPLLKDPFAIFSVPWYSEVLNCDVVIVIRHPAAAVSSLKRLGWNFDFADLLAQEQLMQDWLEPFRADIEFQAGKQSDLISQGALLWRIVYYVASKLALENPKVQIVRHEELSRHPEIEFQKLYAHLELPFSEKARRGIRRATQEKNPSELSMRSIYSTKLDSAANLRNWRKRLSNEEIARIWEITKDVASNYYTDEDWD